MDGSPLPNLAWFVGSDRIQPSKDVGSGSHSAMALNITVSREDNVRDYRCEATNEANLNQPSATSAHFNVFFAPSDIEIKVERPNRGHNHWDRTETFKQAKKFEDDSFKIVTEGDDVRLVCVTGEAGGKKKREMQREQEASDK